MSFPPRAGNSDNGNGGSGNGGKMITMGLSTTVESGQGEFRQILFDLQPDNDGFGWTENHEVEILEAGTILINASFGVAMANDAVNPITVVGFVFKNGVPLQQNSKTKTEGPYCIAPVTRIDKCAVGDKYTFYINAQGGDDLNVTIASSDNGVTGAQISYL